MIQSHKILYLNLYAGSPSLGMEFRPFFLAKEWCKQGHRVEIVAGSFSHYRATSNIHMSQLIEKSDVEGIPYRWIKLPKYEGNGFRRLINMLVYTLMLFILTPYFVLKFRPTVVLASSTMPFDIFPAFLIAFFSRARLVHEVHDLWPLTPRLLGNFSKWHPVIIIMQIAETFACKKAHRIVSLLPGTKKYHVEKGVLPSDWIYIPNGVQSFDTTELEKVRLPNEIEIFIQETKAHDKLLLSYTGSLSSANAMLDFLKKVEHIKDHYNILVVGDGSERAPMLQYQFENALEHVLLHPRVSKPVADKIVMVSDLLYIGWKRSELYQFGISPNKIMDYMKLGKPILHEVEAFNDPVAEAKCGISILPGDLVGFHDACSSFREMTTEQRHAMGMNGLKFVTSERDYEKLSKRFLTFVTN